MSIYISEYNVWSASGGDFVEVVAPAGTDLSGYSFYGYNPDGTIKNGPFSFGAPVATENGVDIYVIEQSTTPGFELSYNTGLALVDDQGDVAQFLSRTGNPITATQGPAAGQTSQQTASPARGESVQSDDGGQSYYRQSDQNRGTAPCFAPGTLIETETGPRAIELLRVGDRVRILSGALAPLVWTGAMPATNRVFQNHGYPILIKAGALGGGLPQQDLIVSPQHRILVGEADQLTQLFETSQLVAAKSLLRLPGIREMRGKRRITWHHIACQAHHLIRANGCATETLYPGPMVLASLRRSQRAALRLSLADSVDLAADAAAPSIPLARPALSVQAARAMIARQRLACA